jgi:hypothetical protein
LVLGSVHQQLVVQLHQLIYLDHLRIELDLTD